MTHLLSFVDFVTGKRMTKISCVTTNFANRSLCRNTYICLGLWCNHKLCK